MQPSPCVAFVPELGVFDLPCAFSTSTAEEINEVLNQSDFKTKLDALPKVPLFVSSLLIKS